MWLQAGVFLVAALIQGSVSQVCKAASETICDAECNVAFCIEEGGEPMVIETCSAGKYCFQNKTGEGDPTFECSAAKCSNANTAHPFTCLQSGTFPSPYDCKTSYICGGARQDPLLECTCGDNQTFDAASATCKPADAAAECPAAPECAKSGQNGKLKDLTDYCFVCDGDWNANVYRCGAPATPSTPPTDDTGTVTRSSRGGTIQAFAKTQQCKPYVKPAAPGSSTPPTDNTNPPGTTTPPTDNTNPPGTTTPPTDNTNPPGTTTPPTDNTNPPGTTTPPTDNTNPPGTTTPPTDNTNPPGTTTPPTDTTPAPTPAGGCTFHNQRIADRTACAKYYVCNAALIVVEKTCPNGYRFDRTRLACLKGTCPQ